MGECSKKLFVPVQLVFRSHKRKGEYDGSWHIDYSWGSKQLMNTATNIDEIYSMSNSKYLALLSSYFRWSWYCFLL